MTKRLKRLHYSPLVTNASVNRSAAMRAFNGGLSAEDISKEWPRVFRLDPDGKLSQIYDSELMDGTGRLETRYTITSTSVDEAIRRRKAKD